MALNISRKILYLSRSLRRLHPTTSVKGRVLCPEALLFKNSVETIRFKYTPNTGVKGIRNRKYPQQNAAARDDVGENDENYESDVNLDDSEYDALAGNVMNVSRQLAHDQRVLVIQPYVKWGPRKNPTKPELRLQEAEALIHSLPEWRVEHSMKVPLETLEKQTLFGKGKLEELKKQIKDFRAQGKLITCVFISKGTLSHRQKKILGTEFGLPIFDRYSIVIQILRLHAISTEAKLQVAMAEIPYIWTQMKDSSDMSLAGRRQPYSLSDTQKEVLRKREKKLKQELENIRSHRKLLRSKRKQKSFPIVAIVGYTNCGKTSLIKALTDEKKIQPRDQLFATLDVTAHAGRLPCNLEVVYMDTVGFMSDIPTGLIECFISTLEDAMMADIIIHVQDLSHECCLEQKLHVEKTLQQLMQKESLDEVNIINVGNKVDLLPKSTEIDNVDNIKLISAKTLIGIHDLMLDIENKILEATDRTKITFRVANGGEEMAWLYKNTAVTDASVDPTDAQLLLLKAVITNSKLQQFRHYILQSNQ